MDIAFGFRLTDHELESRLFRETEIMSASMYYSKIHGQLRCKVRHLALESSAYAKSQRPAGSDKDRKLPDRK